MDTLLPLNSRPDTDHKNILDNTLDTSHDIDCISYTHSYILSEECLLQGSQTKPLPFNCSKSEQRRDQSKNEVHGYFKTVYGYLRLFKKINKNKSIK